MAKDDLEYKKTEYQNICKWIATCIAAARGTSLLSEIQTGLQARVQHLANVKNKISVVVGHPFLEANKKQKEMEAMIGSIKYNTLVAVSHDVSFSTKHVTAPLTEIFQKPRKLKHTIDLPSACYRLSVVNDEVWVPIPSKNSIHIYDHEGQQVKTMEQNGKQPRAVQQLNSGEIVMASAVGLILFDKDGKELAKISDGNFSDVDTQDDFIATLNTATNSFTRFLRNGNGWKEDAKMSLYRAFNQTGTIVHFNDFFYVCSTNAQTIQKYNKSGQFIADLGRYTGNACSDKSNPGSLYTPYICAASENGSLLVADYADQRIQVLDCDYEWKVYDKTSFPSIVNPYDVICDSHGQIWIVNGNNKLLCYA